MARIEKDGKTVYVPDGLTLEIPSGFGNIGMEYDSWEDYVFVEMRVGVDALLREILAQALADNPAMQERVERVEPDGIQGLESWLLSGAGDSAARSVRTKLRTITSHPARARALVQKEREMRIRQAREWLAQRELEEMRQHGTA